MVTRERLVVEEIEDQLTQITVAAAVAFKPDAVPGDVVVTEQLGQDAFGRIGAQTAKQVVLQRLREAERDVVYDLSLIHISEPTRLGMISYAVFCLKKKK